MGLFGQGGQVSRHGSSNERWWAAGNAHQALETHKLLARGSPSALSASKERFQTPYESSCMRGGWAPSRALSLYRTMGQACLPGQACLTASPCHKQGPPSAPPGTQQHCPPHRDEAVLLPAVAQHGVRVVALDERELQAQAQHTAWNEQNAMLNHSTCLCVPVQPARAQQTGMQLPPCVPCLGVRLVQQAHQALLHPPLLHNERGVAAAA